MEQEANRHLPIEEMEFFLRFIAIADWIWNEALKWNYLAQRTVGEQLIRASDSIGANLVEGDGRYHAAESIHFFRIARGSAREARYWLNRAIKRQLIGEKQGKAKINELMSATRQLNALINYRCMKKQSGSIKEVQAIYNTDKDPFIE